MLTVIAIWDERELIVTKNIYKTIVGNIKIEKKSQTKEASQKVTMIT